ncbi:MAG: VWA domain-containing protein [Gemmatimonadaceae bacterium]|nr:VWA domain-containing protein [Gemmatimonadaceae bacterium]
MRLHAKACGLAAAFSALSLAACSDSTGPNTKPIQSLSVSGVRVNAADFATNGKFDLGLIATAADSSAILDPGVGVTVTLTSLSVGTVSAYTVTRDNTAVSNPQNADTRAAILLDDSGSMSSNDPTKLRASAAELFWKAVLPVRTGNRVALLDFGASATTGFTSSRLLQDFTASDSALTAQKTRIVASGGTPLYESLLEVVNWMVANTTTSQNRVILLMSDGQPNSSARKADAITAAKNANITVHTVGLGPASDLSASSSAGAVAAVRDVAEQTDGVYAAATTADALAPIFNALARATSRGQLISTFRISPIPASGTRISGTVTVTAGGSTGTANWSFVAP